MSIWKKGMKAVCTLKQGGWVTDFSNKWVLGPMYGEVCEVLGLSMTTGHLGLLLKEYPYCEGEGYWAMYFRPLDTLEEQLAMIESEPIEEHEPQES